jgi:hypothetical protein
MTHQADIASFVASSLQKLSFDYTRGVDCVDLGRWHAHTTIAHRVRDPVAESCKESLGGLGAE